MSSESNGIKEVLNGIKERQVRLCATQSDVGWLLAEVDQLQRRLDRTTKSTATTTTVTSRAEQIELITAAMMRRLPLSQESTVRQLATIAIDVLAGLSCTLPSAATIESWYDASAMIQEGQYMLRGPLAVEYMLRSMIAPILVAQSAEVAELRIVDVQHRCARSACVEAGIQDMPLVQDMVDTLRKQRDDALTLPHVGECAMNREVLKIYHDVLRPLKQGNESLLETLHRLVNIANDWREDGGVWKKRIGDVSLTAGRDITIHSPSFLAAVVHGNMTMSMCGIASIVDAKKLAEQIAKTHFAEHIGAAQ